MERRLLIFEGGYGRYSRERYWYRGRERELLISSGRVWEIERATDLRVKSREDRS